MKLKHGNLILLFFICFTPIAMASVVNESKPTRCPSVAALQRIHVKKSDLIEIGVGRWSVKEYISRFDTVDRWSFNLETIQANNVKQALQEANNKLSSLVFAYGPTRYIYLGKWHCSYHSSTNDVRTVYLDA